MSNTAALPGTSHDGNVVVQLAKPPLLHAVARKLKHWRRVIQGGIETANRYHLLGLYSTRVYMNITAKYNALAKEIGDVCMMVCGGSSVGELVKRTVGVRRNLSNMIKQTGLYRLSWLLSYFLSDCDIYEYAGADIYDRSGVMLRHFHPVRCRTVACHAFRRLGKCNWMAVERMAEGEIEPHICNRILLHVHGCRLFFYEHVSSRMLCVDGFFDNINVYVHSNEYVDYKLNVFRGCKKMKTKYYSNILNTLSLRDVVIHDKNSILEYYSSMHTQFKVMKQQKISQNIILFDKRSLCEKYSMIYMFLIDHGCIESSYMAYLMYDLLSSDAMSTLDSNEQHQIFEGFVYGLKVIFKDVMQSTIKYTRKIIDADGEFIPYEQQICLLRCSEYVKQKAMAKFKEIKNKSDDSSSKAKQYLDGLLKIPFGHYYIEDIVGCCRENVDLYTGLLDKYRTINGGVELATATATATGDGAAVAGRAVTNVDIMHNLECIKLNFFDRMFEHVSASVYELMGGLDRPSIIALVLQLNGVIKAFNAGAASSDIRFRKICHSSKNKESIIEGVVAILKRCVTGREYSSLWMNLMQCLNIKCNASDVNIHDVSAKIHLNNCRISEYVKNVGCILDEAVHGHRDAKNSMQRIIAQWINGEQTGHCLGFEGPPGCGKTSFAKHGIAKCLKNSDGTHRPFAFIALGGSSNASFLEGHSYTYVGSTWGKIVDILIEKQCMNPIIFIDELDKISRTEHGKEINGILTHLIDTTQNHEFYDKYFMGIPLDLSKVLFIFSYNDASLIDKIVLDRIHRIQFEPLSLDDKVTIAKKHIVPQLLVDVGLTGYVDFDDEVLTFIIKNYTRESGVRRLKELLYEVVSEINLVYMRHFDEAALVLPISLTVADIRDNYFKKKVRYVELRPSSVPLVGVVNGLWANTLKEGGVLPIEVSLFPTDTFLEFKLTGMQGDVMKESMHVAKTVVWSILLDEGERVRLYDMCKESKMQGIHVHCSEGATPKDGPSAGMAITLALYSALSSCLEPRLVRSMVAMTGEINLRGEIGEIGGLDSKILGGLNVGITEFVYPSANVKDFELFMHNFSHRYDPERVTFRAVSHIKEILPYIFEGSGD